MLFCSKAFIVTILKKERTIALLLFFYFLSHLKLDIINNVSIFPFNGIKIYLVYSLFTIVLPIRHIVICLKSLVLSFYSNRVCLSNPLLILGMYMIPARLFRVRSKRELLFMSPSSTH